MGIPFSAVTVSARRVARASISLENRSRASARSAGSRSDQPVPSKARRAAATAASTSAARPTGVRPMTSSVEAETTVLTSGEWGATHWPSMNREL
jgi:hypothetical protein